MALTPELCKEFMDLIYSIKKQIFREVWTGKVEN